ncbi:MAG: putative lipid II flippase FtsW [Verrucomicrobiota bacterium]
MKVAVTVLTFCVAALLSLGMVMLYSSSIDSLDRRTHTEIGAHYLVMQLIWCGLGLGLCAAAALTNSKLLKKFAWPILGLMVVLLILVVIPHVGKRINGASRWFSFHGVSFQPSEFAKIALILALAWYGERFQRHMHTWWRGIVYPGLFIGLTLGLIFIEPDVGNALLLAAVSSVMLLAAGIRWRYFLPPVLACLFAVGVFIYKNPMRSERIYSWLHLEETRRDKGLQAYQARIALGSGGWTGLGLGNGRQKLGWVPEHHTDFILAIIGEELGLIATLLIIAAFIAIVTCGVYIARHGRDTFSMLLATGITFLIGVQAMINIAVVTNTFPNKGLPLPFISYGGSNLLAMLTCVGLLLSVARQGRTIESRAGDDLDVIEPQIA